MSYKLISRACFSMIVKEERKVITVVFPDGRDGRTFTLKVGCVPRFSFLVTIRRVGIWECVTMLLLQ